MQHEKEIKKKLITLFIFLLSFFCSYSQFDDINHEIDSINSILDKKSAIDSSLCRVYYELGNRYFKTNKLELAKNNINKSITLSKLFSQGSTIMQSFQTLGIIKHYQSQLDSAIYYFKKANKFAHQEADSGFIANTYMLIANIYINEKREYDNGHKYLDSSEFFLNTVQTAELLINKSLKGNLLYQLCLFDEALIQYREGLKIAREKNKSTIPFINDIANVYFTINDLDYAKKHILQAINQVNIKSFGDSVTYAQSFYNLGTIYHNQNQYDSALVYLNKTKDIYKSLSIKNKLFVSQIAISGDVLFYMDKNQSIIEYQSIDTTNLSLSHKIQYLSLGLRLKLIKPNINKSTKYIETAFKQNLYSVVIPFAHLTYSYYKKQNDLSNALLFNEYYTRAKDSVLSLEKFLDVQKIKVKELLDEKNETILQNNIQKIVLNDRIELSESRKLYWVLISFTSILIIILLYFLLRKNIRIKKYLSSKNNELKQNLLKIGEEIKNKNQVIDNLEKLSFGSKIIKDKLIDDLSTESDWAEFFLKFETLHPRFTQKLSINSNKKLSNNELRLASLVKLNLSNKEISEIMFITIETVKKAKQRLKKKLDLKGQDRITEYIREL